MTERSTPVACSLAPSAMEGRTQRWQRLADTALVRRERTEEGARQLYEPSEGVETELRELVRLEAECCAFLELSVSRRPEAIQLEVRGPAEAEQILALFGGDR